MSRELGIAFLIALSIHVLGMSAVTIVTPEGAGRFHPYTRIDFLGSILRKTTFDIMLEDTERSPIGSYDEALEEFENVYFKERLIRIDPAEYKPKEYFDNVLDMLLSEFLTGKKKTPDIVRTSGTFRRTGKEYLKEDIRAVRKVIYRGEKPHIDPELYGRHTEYAVTVEVLIAPDGKVKRAEPVKTTGLRKIDNIATEFVKKWIFEPDTRNLNEDQLLKVEIRLVPGEKL